MTKFRKFGVSDMEEYIQKLLYYLPIDFGDTENNEYKTYLVRACCENYTNEKFQFSLMAFHMLFMAFLYKEFWTLKTYSHERVERLCRANGQFESVENVFDSSIIPEQTFIDGYLGVFSWHANKRSEVKEFVDKRDRCAHNSGFIQYDQEAVGKYFDDVLKNIEKIASANAENIQSTFKSSIMRYINSPAFQTTSMGDFIQRELADKKYSYRDICAFLTFDIPALPLGKKIAYLFALIYFQEKCKQDNFQEYIDEGSDYVQQLSNLLLELSAEELENVRIQIEDEVGFLEAQGFDLNEILNFLPAEDE